MSSSKLFDIFAEFQKNMHREIGALMGSVVAASNGPSPTPIIPSLAFEGLESRILAAVDERLKAFEEKMTPVRIGVKRTRTPTVSSDDEDDEIPAPSPPPAPIKVNRAVALQVDDSAVASLTEKLHAISVKQVEEVKTPVKVEEVKTPVKVEPEPVEVKAVEVKPVEVKAPVKADEEDADKEDADEEDADDDDDDDEEDDDEEESLTEIMYKGKKYYMDGEYNIYGVDAEGELVEDPVGLYDEKTRRIVFHNQK